MDSQREGLVARQAAVAREIDRRRDMMENFRRDLEAQERMAGALERIAGALEAIAKVTYDRP